MGYFPCAPYHPTLAVDIRMLQFVTKLFVRVSPNNTAWCATVEDFLQGLGYKLASTVCALFFNLCIRLDLMFVLSGVSSPTIWCRSDVVQLSPACDYLTH